MRFYWLKINFLTLFGLLNIIHYEKNDCPNYRFAFYGLR